MNTFILGVVSSVLAAIICYCSRFLIGPLVNLVFFRMFPNVSGKYRVDGDHSRDAFPNQREVVTLKQFANRLSGTSETFSGEILKAKFAVHGRITQTRILILWFDSVTPGHHNYGTAVLHLTTDGTSAKGEQLSLCVTCEDVTSTRIKLVRIAKA